jgi:hypothetical protein
VSARQNEVHTHWNDGRVLDEHPAPVSPWSQIVAVLALLLLFDAALAFVPEHAAEHAIERGAPGAAELRRTLADAVASEGRSILLVGDSVLAGDVLAGRRAHDWREHRVVEYMRRELAPHADASLHQVALDGLLPIDALHLLAELDRIDPEGHVEFVFEINLRYFSGQYADVSDCTRPEICQLGSAAGDEGGRPLQRGWKGVAEAGTRSRDWLSEHLPVHRHRPRLDGRSLDELDELAVPVEREASADEDDDASDIESRARMLEHYRSASIRAMHEQRIALAEILDRLAARGRPGTLFLTPLEDRFAASAMNEDLLGRRYAAIAGMVNDRSAANVNLIDLDHPLFVDAHFIDHVHLGPDGARLLAINVLHELGLPLRNRPFEQEMVHPEGFDRTLVHRVERGYAEGGATLAQLDRPEGVAVDRAGRRVVIADTQNDVLRELRGNMQFVETIAGRPNKPGESDGAAANAAQLDKPRLPELRGDAVWFIDGELRDRVRVLEDGWVRTASWIGPDCGSSAYRRLRARADAIWILCDDGVLLRLEPERGRARMMSKKPSTQMLVFDVGPGALYFADIGGRLWKRDLLPGPDGPSLGKWTLLFRNGGQELIPNGHGVGFPYHFDDVRLANVVDLQFVERYGGLLVADEFPLHTRNEDKQGRLENEWTERVHLRYIDLEAERVLPWIKALTHGEGHVMYNQDVDQFASYWHLGSMALVQDDASLIWVERMRSRVLRIADGMLGLAKTGNHHTRAITVPYLTTIGPVSRRVEAQMRPDRYLDRRYEPLPRKGPYVGVVFGSSLSSMSDRFANYSLGRRLELELQRELGYRDQIRLDIFQISWPASPFRESVNNFANWMSTSVPPDLVFIEAHDFGSNYLRNLEEPGQLSAAFVQLQQLAERYDTLVVFYDISSMEANRRESMRSTDPSVRMVLDDARRLGFVVLDPGDRLFAQLLMHSPWGNQPFDDNQHHGSTWAVDLTAETLASSVAPILRDFLRDRTPARLRERPPEEFDAREEARDPLRLALSEVTIDSAKLPRVANAYVQTDYVDRQLLVYVDLAGFRAEIERRNLDMLAVAVILQVLRDDVYADLAESLSLELVEFENYDEYGNGVIGSANSLWRREFDREGLRDFLLEHQPR